MKCGQTWDPDNKAANMSEKLGRTLAKRTGNRSTITKLLKAKLQLNTDKTELLLIGTKQQLQKINMSTLCVGNNLIRPSKEVKNLGVWLDPSLTMNTHINKTCSIAF